MTDRPDPMVSAEVDLRDFAFMPLDVLRLRDSDLACVEDAEVFRCAVLSWCVSWHQVPAASLPDDDTLLARLLGFGRDVKGWKRVRAAGGMRGWVLCSDGRLYHEVVAEKARDAWDGKLAQRWRTEAARVKKHNQRHQLEGAAAVQMPEFAEWKAAGCPQGQPLNVPGTTGQSPKGNSDPVPRETASKGQGEGQGQGQGQGDLEEGIPGANAPSSAAADPDRPALTLVSPEPPGLPDCPHQELIALYAKHLPQLRQPMRWDGERAEAMRSRWRECSKPTAFGDGYRTKGEGLEFWDRFFAYVAATPKLAEGIRTREGGQERIWKPSLDWLVQRANFTKVIEGAYAT